MRMFYFNLKGFIPYTKD